MRSPEYVQTHRVEIFGRLVEISTFSSLKSSGGWENTIKVDREGDRHAARAQSSRPGACGDVREDREVRGRAQAERGVLSDVLFLALPLRIRVHPARGKYEARV